MERARPCETRSVPDQELHLEAAERRDGGFDRRLRDELMIANARAAATSPFMHAVISGVKPSSSRDIVGASYEPSLVP